MTSWVSRAPHGREGEQTLEGPVQVLSPLSTIIGLHKGAGACLLRDIQFSVIYFPVYAYLKKDVSKKSSDHRLTICER